MFEIFVDLHKITVSAYMENISRSSIFCWISIRSRGLGRDILSKKQPDNMKN